MKYNYENHVKRVKSFCPSWEVGILFLSLAMYNLGKDLNLEKFTEFNSVVFTVELVFVLCWFIDFLVLFFIKVHRDKKNGRQTESTK